MSEAIYQNEFDYNSNLEHYKTKTKTSTTNPKCKNSTLKILHWNANSIKSKIDNLTTYILENEPDIILINEIKCNQTQALSLLNLEAYSL